MPHEPLEQPIDCSTAEELLDELAPHRGQQLWDRPDNGNWIFRGQSEAAWALTPSAQRTEMKTYGAVYKEFVPFLPAGQLEMPPWTLAERRTAELDVVNRFAGIVGVRGLEVPGDNPEFRDVDKAVDDDGSGVLFPAMRRFGMFALAQHYGVPTRFLDWTSKPLVAAYFAAVETARRLHVGVVAPKGSDGRLAVWAVRHDFVDQHCRKWDPAGAIVVTVPTVSNPNLHAQGGLFTLIRFKRKPGPDEDVPTLDALFRDSRNVDAARNIEGLPFRPMMFKLTLPHTEASRLLAFLDLHDVNASTVFPGHKSVAEYLREGRFKPVVRPRRE